jgi:hypothetical protein
MRHQIISLFTSAILRASIFTTLVFKINVISTNGLCLKPFNMFFPRLTLIQTQYRFGLYVVA